MTAITGRLYISSVGCNAAKTSNLDEKQEVRTYKVKCIDKDILESGSGSIGRKECCTNQVVLNGILNSVNLRLTELSFPFSTT